MSIAAFVPQLTSNFRSRQRWLTPHVTTCNPMCCAHNRSVSRRQALKIASSICASLLISKVAVRADENTSTGVVSDIDPATDEPTITERVYFDFAIPGDGKAGSKDEGRSRSKRLVIGLYGDLMPVVVDNFKTLVTSPTNGYSNTIVYRIVPGLTIQMGDVLDSKGKTGRSALAKRTPVSACAVRLPLKSGC